jgi:hypothetical protein
VPAIERRESDTPRSLAALIAYCEMGPTRSLEKLVQMWATTGLESPPTKWLSTLKRWSTDGAWVDRASAYDSAVQADESAARAALRQQRRAELEDRDWSQASNLRSHLDALLARLPQFLQRSESETTVNGERVRVITLALNTSAGELARAMKLASEIQRLSVGAATEHIQHEHAWIDSAAEALDRKLLPDMATDETAGIPGEPDA